MTSWTDQFVGDRMTVDREFSERVAASEFSSQEWGTIMTGVELEIDRPESPADAQVVADTSRIDQVMPAIEEMRESLPGTGTRPGGSGGGRGDDTGADESGFLSSVKRSLGFGDDDRTAQRAEAAAALADEYARRFQEHLEHQGKWERACQVAAAGPDGDGPATAGFEAGDATDATTDRHAGDSHESGGTDPNRSDDSAGQE